MRSNNDFKKLEELIDSFNDKFDDKIIYHYTSIEGFKGIIENNELWLTNTEFVNDTMECKTFYEYIDQLIASEIKNENVKTQLREWKRDKEHQNTNGHDDVSSYYIASFSKEDDSLEQWRAYGSYCCIGFEVDKLVKNKFNLYECIYNNEQLKIWLNIQSQKAEWDSLDNSEYKTTAAHILVHAALVKSKNIHFINEKEVRLFTVSDHNWKQHPNSPSIYLNQASIHFRQHAAFEAPVPYVKFFLSEKCCQLKPEVLQKMDKREVKKHNRETEEKSNRLPLPIKKIIIGPIQHKIEEKKACEIFLNEKGYSDCEVTVSEIPYRGF